MSCVVWPSRPRWGRQQLVDLLLAALVDRAERVYLIGSFARDEATGESDVDLIIVAPTSLPWPERWRPFADLRAELGAVDLIVYTSEEWERLEAGPTPFLAHAAESWVRIL